MRRPALLSLLCLALPLALPWRARADSDQHYADAVVGERAAGMGGAFVALADEASGAYYNPAGIVVDRSAILQLSMTAFQLRRKEVDAADLCGTMITDNQNAFFSFPASFGFVKTLRTGSIDHGFGLTLAMPHYRRISQAYAEGDVGCGAEKVGVGGSTLVVDRVLWGGVSYAIRPWQRLRLGLTVGFTVRTASYNVLQAVVVQGSAQPQPPGETPLPPGIVFASIDVDIWSMFVQAGAVLELLEGLSVGVSLTPPHFRLSGSGRYDELYAESNANAWEQTTLRITDDVRYDWKVPLAVALGLAYRRHRQFTLAADVRLHAPQARHATLEHPDVPERQGMHLERRLVVNGHLGGEVWIGSRVALRLGGFTNFSSLPRDDAEYDLERVDLFGFTAGGTFASSAESTLSFAVQGQIGRGKTKQYVLSQDAAGKLAERYVDGRSTEVTLILTVGGSFDIR